MPVFAFFSAGVAVGGWAGWARRWPTRWPWASSWPWCWASRPASWATTWLLTKVTRARLDASFKWIDIFGVSILAGIGFTVSLLVAELSFGQGSVHDDHAKVGILAASVLAALLGHRGAAAPGTGTTAGPRKRKKSIRTTTASPTSISRTLHGPAGPALASPRGRNWPGPARPA